MNLVEDKKNTYGLTSLEAEKLLKINGKNEITKNETVTQFQQILKVFSDPMGLMMLGLAALYFFTHDTTDAIIILIAYIPVTGVDVFLQLKSEKALKALQARMQMTAKVFRDGLLQDIPIQYLVPGDVFAFEEGQSVPADGEILESQNLSINESALTGESIPVDKNLRDTFYAGTSVISGRGFGLIQKTAQNTQFGKISHLLEQTKNEDSLLQKKVDVLVKKIVLVAAGLVIILFLMEFLRHGELMKSLITALTFGMAAVPEEFPLVFTLYLSLGAYRLSKHGVLVKTLPSVESLGNVDVICTDKTGTLTEGHFSLVDIVPFGSVTLEELNLIALLACEPIAVDSMEVAIYEKLSQYANNIKQWKLIYDYPFEAMGKHMTHIWSNENERSILAMKGSVEGILEHAQVDEEQKKIILQKVNELAFSGKRILGLATKAGSFKGLRSEDEKQVSFVGLLVFSDPIRSSARKAIEDCQASGIEIKMLTGDHYLTAHAIADELKIKHSEKSIYSGVELNKMTLENRIQAYLTGAIFARVTPEQKYEMIKTLKDHHKTVAMTGDGINDSPALKLADIGVSMGENATDVARATAKIILIKNDFNGLVQAIFEGRNIFSNLRRSFSYLISFHIPVVLLAFLPPMLGWPYLLMPVHIILLELIVHPISAFAFENLKESNFVRMKTLIPSSTAITATLSGVLLSILSLIPIIINHGQNELSTIRSIMLSTLLFGNIGFTFVEAWPSYRSKKIIVILVLLAVLPYIFCNIPFFSQIFHLAPLTGLELLKAMLVGFLASVPTFLFRRIKD